MPWFIDRTCSWYKDGRLSKLFSDGRLFRKCWSEKVAEWWDFTGGAGVLQANRGKGCCRPGVWTKLTAVNQHQCLGTWVVLKAEEGEREGGSVTGAGLKHVLPVSLSLQPCFSFLSNYRVSFVLDSSVSFSSPQWSLLTAACPPYLLPIFHLILHHDSFNENIVYLLFSCKSLVTLC